MGMIIDPYRFGAGYRYLLLEIVAVATNSFDVQIRDMDWWDPATSEWKPIAAMTTNSAPSPLVAFATENSAGNDYFEAYDNDNASGSVYSTSQTPAPTFSPAVWHSLDVGAGNEFSPTKFRLSPQDVNRAPQAFTCYGSNDANSMSTPSSATKTTLNTQTGLTTGWTAGTYREFTF